MMVGRSIETQSMNKPSASLDSGSLTFSFSSLPPPPDKIGYEISSKGIKSDGLGAEKAAHKQIRLPGIDSEALAALLSS